MLSALADVSSFISVIMQEFKANTNAVDIVYNVFPTPLTVWFLRIHIVKHSTAIAGTKLKLFGCEDTAATKPC
jgi:hypothetical protein